MKSAIRGNFLLMLLSPLWLSGCLPTELPAIATIQVTTINLPNTSASLLATQPYEGVVGTWSIIGNPAYPGSFSNEHDPLATFIGQPFVQYQLRWTLSNGTDEIYGEYDLHMTEGFTLAELVASGMDLKYFYEANISTTSLFSAGATIEDLIEEGVTIEELINLGVTVKQLMAVGVSAGELVEAGAISVCTLHTSRTYGWMSVGQLFDEGVSLTEFINASSCIRSHEVLEYSSVEDLVAAGASLYYLISAGATGQALIDNGYSLQELMDVGYYVEDLLLLGASEVELIANGNMGTVIDAEGREYPWVKIWDTKWMAEDLQTSINSRGDEIGQLYNSHYFDGYLNYYGRIYSLSESSLACPTGWKIPDGQSWSEMITFLGPDPAKLLKIEGTGSSTEGMWAVAGNVAGTNRTGFSARPGGSQVGFDNGMIGLKVVYHADHFDYDGSGSSYYYTMSYNTTTIGRGSIGVRDLYRYRAHIRCAQ